MENRLYAFDWKYIGDIELGRPNLGKMARLEIYRLFQYTLRDVLETEYGTGQSERLLYKRVPRRDGILQTVCWEMRIVQRFRR